MSEVMMKNTSEWLPEWTAARALWLRWPYRADIFSNSGQAAQQDLLVLLEKLQGTGLAVQLMVPSAERSKAEQAIAAANLQPVSLHEVDYGDVWLRDCAPFVGADGIHRHFAFDSWGGIDDQWPLDIMARDWLSRSLGAKTQSFTAVLEGGAIYTDGEGTALACTGSTIYRAGNEDWSPAAFEKTLHESLGIEKVLWLPGRLSADETGGHVDNMACFLAPGRIALNMPASRSEEHTSELQSRPHLVCRLLLEKKKKTPHSIPPTAARVFWAPSLVSIPAATLVASDSPPVNSGTRTVT